MTYFRKHVFICTNLREGGKQCCESAGASDIWRYAKKKISEFGLAGRGGIRVSHSGCLGRCAEGPVLVIYPEGVWYTYTNTQDIDEIIEQHLIQGKIVERLVLPGKD